MTPRRTALALILLVVPLVLTASAPGAPKPGGSPAGPTNLRITASTDTSASLAWDAAGNSKSDWWYCVQRDGLGCFRVDPPRTTITFPSLMPGQTFNWSVITVSASGKRSAPSNTVTFTTPPDTTPPTAPTLSVDGVWTTRVAVSWTSSSDVSGASYTLLLDGSPYPSGEVSFRQLTVLDLAPASTHSLTVRASDRFGNTSQSNTETVTTPPKTDDTPPTAPSNLRFSPETTVDEIWLDWDPSTDDTDSQALILYEILVNGVRDHRVIGGTDTIVYCPAVVPATFTVRAVDASGNVSGPSNELSFC